MTTLLVVKGHPLTAEDSFSLKGLDAFVAAYKAANPSDEIQVLDVFQANIPEVDEEVASGYIALQSGKDFSDLTASQQDKISRLGGFTEQFIAADKVVIANPLWNLMIPASLKKWIDTINVAGKTFRYTANGPEGLTNGKKIMHLQANGGTYEGNDPASQYLKGIFEFIGSDYNHIAMEGQAYAPEQAEALLAAFIEKVETAAKTF